MRETITLSRLAQVTDTEGFIKAFAYDLRDNIGTVTDGRGGATAFTYDALDRRIAKTVGWHPPTSALGAGRNCPVAFFAPSRAPMEAREQSRLQALRREGRPLGQD